MEVKNGCKIIGIEYQISGLPRRGGFVLQILGFNEDSHIEVYCVLNVFLGCMDICVSVYIKLYEVFVYSDRILTFPAAFSCTYRFLVFRELKVNMNQ